jgi:glucuronate isomerase
LIFVKMTTAIAAPAAPAHILSNDFLNNAAQVQTLLANDHGIDIPTQSEIAEACRQLMRLVTPPAETLKQMALIVGLLQGVHGV